jgi:hypothetical protein
MTEKARRDFRASFDTGHKCTLCPETIIDSSLPSKERRRQAEALYRAHMTRVSHTRKVVSARADRARQQERALAADLAHLGDAV